MNINLLFLENTLSADTGCLVFGKARKHNQFLNIHRVKHLHIWHITPERGKKKEVKAFGGEPKLQDKNGVCIICNDLHSLWIPTL